MILDLIANCIPMNKYYSSYLEKLVDEGKAEVVEVGQDLQIDDETLLIKRVINIDEASYIRYSFITFNHGWFLSGKAIKVMDDQGNEYRYKSDESEYRTWGEDGILKISKIDEDAKYLILKLDWYDRQDEIRVSLTGDD